MKANKSISNFNTFAITSSITIIGEKLYQAGFLSPFGLIPSNIKNLSPIVFNSKSQPKSSNVNPICYDSNVIEKIIFEKEIGRIRDIKIHPKNGKIYLLAQDKLWLFEKNN